MKQTNLENLQIIFNSLCEISTKGSDTIMMGQCLQVLQQIIQDETNFLKEEAVEGE